MSDPYELSRHQIFRGYEIADLDLLRRYATAPVDLMADRYRDGFGVITLHSCVPFVDPALLSADRLAFPVPDDGFHAETIEYLAVCESIQRAQPNEFVAAEIGAGWGPWIGLAGVLARGAGINLIRLVGVEASRARFALLNSHLAVNGLRPEGTLTDDALFNGVHSRLFRGAVWTHNGEVFFPETTVTDMGPSATATQSDHDYRGLVVEQSAVPCKTLETVLEGFGIVDILHIDIQGSERDVVTGSIDWMDSHVKSVLIATHDRAIEGDLMTVMIAHGWIMVREKPCQVNWTIEGPLSARTTQDGAQHWRNPRLT